MSINLTQHHKSVFNFYGRIPEFYGWEWVNGGNTNKLFLVDNWFLFVSPREWCEEHLKWKVLINLINGSVSYDFGPVILW